MAGWHGQRTAVPASAPGPRRRARSAPITASLVRARRAARAGRGRGPGGPPRGGARSPRRRRGPRPGDRRASPPRPPVGRRERRTAGRLQGGPDAGGLAQVPEVLHQAVGDVDGGAGDAGQGAARAPGAGRAAAAAGRAPAAAPGSSPRAASPKVPETRSEIAGPGAGPGQRAARPDRAHHGDGQGELAGARVTFPPTTRDPVPRGRRRRGPGPRPRMRAERSSRGMASATSAHSGRAPMAARSERFTARAFQPTSPGREAARRSGRPPPPRPRWPPAPRRGAARSRAASSPMPSGHALAPERQDAREARDELELPGPWARGPSPADGGGRAGLGRGRAGGPEREDEGEGGAAAWAWRRPVTSPPWASTKLFTMARPRPAPPYSRVVEPSTWKKTSKTRARCSGAMPMPVSAHRAWPPGRPSRVSPRTVTAPPGGRELHRVGAEVHQALAELVAVGGEAGQLARLRRLTSSPFLRASGSSVATASRMSMSDVHLGEHQPDPPGLDLGDVEDGGDELEQVLALLHDDAEVLALLGGERAAQPLQHHLGVADDAGERGAQLVAHGGEEVRLEPVELLQLGVALLELPVLLLQLAVALLDRLDVEPGGDEVLVAGEDQHVEEVRRSASGPSRRWPGHAPDLLHVGSRPTSRRSPRRWTWRARAAARPGRRARRGRRRSGPMTSPS